MIANSKEGWVETFIPIIDKNKKLTHFLKDENEKEIVVRIKGKVEIFELDKQGNRIKVK